MQGFSIRLNALAGNLSGINYGSAIYTGSSTATSAGVQISANAIINASIGDIISVWANSVGIVINKYNLEACSSLSIYLIMPT
jgi:hypothetical protein